MRATGILAVSGKFYRRLLKAYPHSHRLRFSDEMSQVFREVSKAIYEKDGLSGLMGLWLHTLADLLKTAFEERVKGITNMSKVKFILLGAWALMLAGITMIVAFSVDGLFQSTLGVTPYYETFLGILWAAVPLLFGTGLFALRSKYEESLGNLGKLSLLSGGVIAALSFIGVLATAFVRGESIAWYFFIFGILSMSIALMLFGMDAMRKKVFPRWDTLPFILGGLVPLVMIADSLFNSASQNSDIFDILLPVALMGLSIGLILVGILLKSNDMFAKTT